MVLSYTTSSGEDTSIAYALGVENARRAALNPPLGALTAGQYLTSIIQALFASYEQQRQGNDVATMQAKYQAGTAAQKAAMVSAALAAF